MATSSAKSASSLAGPRARERRSPYLRRIRRAIVCARPWGGSRGSPPSRGSARRGRARGVVGAAHRPGCAARLPRDRCVGSGCHPRTSLSWGWQNRMTGGPGPHDCPTRCRPSSLVDRRVCRRSLAVGRAERGQLTCGSSLSAGRRPSACAWTPARTRYLLVGAMLALAWPGLAPVSRPELLAQSASEAVDSSSGASQACPREISGRTRCAQRGRYQAQRPISRSSTGSRSSRISTARHGEPRMMPMPLGGTVPEREGEEHGDHLGAGGEDHATCARPPIVASLGLRLRSQCSLALESRNTVVHGLCG